MNSRMGRSVVLLLLLSALTQVRLDFPCRLEACAGAKGRGAEKMLETGSLQWAVQAPWCGADLPLYAGQSTPLISATYSSPNSCSWKFSCPVDMTLQCSQIQLPWNLFCYWIGFTYNGRTICATSTAFQSPVNVGKTLSARYYTSGSGTSGFKCTVTCGCGGSQSAGKRSQANSTDLDRIVGGSVVPNQGKYPWMAWFNQDQSASTLMCGGSLINDRYVLTAGHCVSKDRLGTYYVVLGDLDRSSSSESVSLRIPASAIIPNQYVEKYSGQVLTEIDNDIALLRLQTPVDFQAYPHIRPICIAWFMVPSPGETVTVAGWGATSWWGALFGSSSRYLMEATLTVASNTLCQKGYGSLFTKNFICAQSAGDDICKGDSGGPLMYRNPFGSFYVNVGINSMAKTCDIQYGAAFTTTAYYVNDFIGENTNDAQWCSPYG
ncbi:unnamed protein product [Darwinula stevensoni]|uniref:Peptidase S1 domain-containing protein n=1 Tax=Darwinula stevensoni TaxID=69355 RepID=A0A7R9FRA8_9CRUS|nr:unnamed protein product [Darwinula stevensoni]CAG0901312.1 unnamed protein product [Darwinula stevensoni]